MVYFVVITRKTYQRTFFKIIPERVSKKQDKFGLAISLVHRAAKKSITTLQLSSLVIGPVLLSLGNRDKFRSSKMLHFSFTVQVLVLEILYHRGYAYPCYCSADYLLCWDNFPIGLVLLD